MSDQPVEISDDDIEAVRAAVAPPTQPPPGPQPAQPTAPIIRPGLPPTGKMADYKVSREASKVVWHDYPLDRTPSGGMSYPPGSRIEYRVYSYAEMEVINRSTLPEVELMKAYLNGIVLKGPSGDDRTPTLAEMDANFLIVQRKLKTLGVDDEFTLEPICPVCGKVKVKKFTLNDLQFDELKDKCPALPMRLPMVSGELKLTLPTVTDLLDFLRLNIPPEKERTWYLGRMASNTGDTRTFQYLCEIIEKTQDPEDQAMLSEAYELAMIRPHDFIVECSGDAAEPHEEARIAIPAEEVRQGLMKPFRPPESSARRKIQFGA